MAIVEFREIKAASKHKETFYSHEKVSVRLCSGTTNQYCDIAMWLSISYVEFNGNSRKYGKCDKFYCLRSNLWHNFRQFEKYERWTQNVTFLYADEASEMVYFQDPVTFEQVQD